MKGVQSSIPSTDLHWKTRGLCGVSERHLDWDGLVAACMVLYEPGRTSSYPTIAPDRGLRYHYLGGGNEVGNVGCILEDDGMNRLLLDYGLAPTSPPKYPHEAPAVTDTIITHSHIDHLGMAPWVVSRHRSKLHGTSLTGAISSPMWRDCHKVSSIEGYPLAWDLRDAEEAASAWEFHRFGEPWQHGDWELRLERAGHIPGAAMVHITTPSQTILFTGDFDSRNSMLVEGAEPEPVDILFVEGTYGGRDHPDQQEETQRFLQRVRTIVDRGGTALIAAFANGRTQDVLMTLHKHLPHLNVHIDGMGKLIAELQLQHPHLLRDPDGLQAAFQWSKRVRTRTDRKRALDADVIVTTSGMLDGGPALWYLNRLRHDERNALFLTGYQAKDSGGRGLLETGTIPIFGHRHTIDIEIDRFDFSTHAGHKEIVDFAAACAAKQVVVYHTDPTHARPPLVEALESNGHIVHSPENGVSGML